MVEEAAIEKIAESGLRIRRLPPSHAACQRETPLLIAMRLCTSLEKGRAWRWRERALGTRGSPFN